MNFLRNFLGVRIVCYLLCFFPLWGWSCEVIDDTGARVVLAHPAKRIVSLAPDITENLFAAGAQKSIVGVMQGSDYPSSAKNIPIVASYDHVDHEKILLLHPDLIVAWDESSFSHSLKKLGIPIYFTHPKTIQDIPMLIKKLGCLAGTENISDRVAKTFTIHYTFLKKKYSARATVSVFYQVWSKPLMTVTQKSWINDVIVLCGGKNIFADLYGVAPEVNVESVVLLNPDVMIATKDQTNWQSQWRRWPWLNAVKHEALFSVSADKMERAGPRLIEGAEDICQQIESVRAVFPK